MKTKQKVAVMILFAIISAVVQVNAQTPNHIMVMPGTITWGEAPSGLPPGAKAAVLEGNPAAAGLFTLRAKIPANYKIMPHTHPTDEHVTVLEGTCYMGLGEKYDEKTAMEMPAGAFAEMDAGTVHYFFSKKGCVIQIHALGPWGITYINPADDPRNKK